MLKNSRKCLTNGSKVCKIARVLSKQHKNEWDLSSAGRASALQAEGHEILYRIECANRISCQKWHEFFCVFLSMCGCRIRSDAALKCVNNAGNVINCDKISKNVTKMFQIFLKNFKNVLTS